MILAVASGQDGTGKTTVSMNLARMLSSDVQLSDPMGTPVHLQCDGLLSRAVQHEIDHLNGIPFIRHMSSLKRGLILRKIRKMLHAGDWGSV